MGNQISVNWVVQAQQCEEEDDEDEERLFTSSTSYPLCFISFQDKANKSCYEKPLEVGGGLILRRVTGANHSDTSAALESLFYCEREGEMSMKKDYWATRLRNHALSVLYSLSISEASGGCKEQITVNK